MQQPAQRPRIPSNVCTGYANRGLCLRAVGEQESALRLATVVDGIRSKSMVHTTRSAVVGHVTQEPRILGWIIDRATNRLANAMQKLRLRKSCGWF